MIENKEFVRGMIAAFKSCEKFYELACDDFEFSSMIKGAVMSLELSLEVKE